MIDDAICAALDAAMRSRCECTGKCYRDDGAMICYAPARKEIAATIAAFLRAAHAAPGGHREWTWRELAAAVERAAQEDRT